MPGVSCGAARKPTQPLHTAVDITTHALAANTREQGLQELLPAVSDVNVWPSRSDDLASRPSGYYIYHQFNIHKFYVLPTQCIYVFCVDLRTNNDYFPIQH